MKLERLRTFRWLSGPAQGSRPNLQLDVDYLVAFDIGGGAFDYAVGQLRCVDGKLSLVDFVGNRLLLQWPDVAWYTPMFPVEAPQMAKRAVVEIPF